MIFNMSGGGGGTGATLTVIAPAGVTVTATKDGKTKTRTADPSGVAVIKGLSTGDWVVTITDGTKNVSKTVTVTADYITEISFFSATIHVAYRPGTTCTATDGVTTLYASDEDNASGTWDCVVPNAGTWTISCNSRGQIKTVDIAENGEEKSVVLPFYLYDPIAGYTFDMYTDCQDSASVNIGTESIDVTFIDFGSGVSIFRNLYRLSSQVGSTIYNTLHMTVKCTEQYINDTYAGYIFAETADVGLYSVNPNAHHTMTKLTGNSIETEYTVDISSISGLGYYGIHGAWKGKVYKIWLE